MTARARQPWWMSLAVFATVAFVRVLGRTWRIVWLPGYAERDAALRAGGCCIFAFWHARLLPLVWTHRGRGIVVLVSRHHDGEWIARVIEHMGFATARGSSTRGGDAAARAMIGFAGEGRHLAITPDGPRGPAERVKAGLVYLASRTGLPVVPVATAARPHRRMRSWDAFRIPAPFARVAVGYGAPVRVPPDLDEAALDAWRVRLEGEIAALTAAADAAVGETPGPAMREAQETR